MLATAFAVFAAATPSLPGFAPDTGRADAWSQQRRGTVTFAVRTAQDVWGRRMDHAAPSASTLKVLLMLTHLRAARGRPLTARDRALLSPMIRWSANAPASELVVRYGPSRIETVARRAGMTSFRLRSPWGDSPVTARDLTRLALRMESLMPARHRAYGMRLLRRVVPAQRWGVARAVPPGWTIYFKGGWGSGSGRVDHQLALLARGDERIALAILTTEQGDHEYGKRTLRGVAKRLLRPL